MADPITLAALRAFVNLTDPRISPNGARVAYVRTIRDFVRDRDVAAIVVAGSDGRTRTLVDAGPFVSAPRWSPAPRRQSRWSKIWRPAESRSDRCGA